MNIESFLPSYPDQSDIYDLYNGDHFNDVIFRKKEFYDLKLQALQPKVGIGERVILNHQEIVSRFLASYTLYDELLLFHQAGTGKTFTAINSVETIIKDSNEYMINKAIILVPNRTIMAGFERELLHVGNKKYLYNIEDIQIQEPEERRKIQLRRSKKLYSKFYSIYTHESFFNELQKMNDEAIKKQYSNSVIIIDEVHQISELKYKTYYNFLHVIENRKILLLSGTPMINDAAEIANVMNLILPKNIELPTGRSFNERYMRDESTLDELIPIFKGRVSYLKSKVNIDYRYNGVSVDDVYLPIYGHTMSHYQYTTYTSTIADVDINTIDNVRRNTLYNQEIHASLFVYPTGLYGEAGFKRFISYSKTREWFKEEFLSKNMNKSVADKLNIVRHYSTKYAFIIQMLLDYPDQNVFIYLEHIKGSGAIILCLCLELFGFVHTTGRDVKLGPRPRYSLLSEVSVGANKKTHLDINNIQSIFNRSSNKTGRFLRVLIGGKMIQQGITFYSIRQIHIVSPSWNFSNIDQAIARGIRIGAHKYLRPNTLVNIYLHSIDVSRVFNIDLYMYRIAQKKDYEIKRVEYLMKISSMDCALTYDRNVDEDGKDNSRECEYNDCIYRCNGVEYPYIRDNNALLLDTYNIYYSHMYIDTLINTLQTIFKTRFYVSIHEIIQLFDNQYTFYQLFQGFNIIIKKCIMFNNKYGFFSYLHEQNNIFFLTNTINDTNLLSSYYCQYPSIGAEETFIEAIDSIINDIINEISEMPFEQQVIEIVKLPYPTQEQFIENALASTSDTRLIEWIIDHYKDNIDITDDYIYSNYLISKNLSNVRRVMDRRTRLWSDLIKDNIGDLPSGLFGIRDITGFKIIDNRDGTGRNKGRMCSSYSKDELIEIMTTLGIDIPPDGNKVIYCNTLEKSNKLRLI